MRVSQNAMVVAFSALFCPRVAVSVRLDDDEAIPLKHNARHASSNETENTTKETPNTTHNATEDVTDEVTVVAPSKKEESLDTIKEELIHALAVAEKAKEEKNEFKAELAQLLKKCYREKISLKQQLGTLKQGFGPTMDKLQKGEKVQKVDVTAALLHKAKENAATKQAAAIADKANVAIGAGNAKQAAVGKQEEAAAKNTAEEAAAAAAKPAEILSTAAAEHAACKHAVNAAALVEQSQLHLLEASLTQAIEARERAEAKARQEQQTAADLYERLEMAKRAGFLMREAGEPCSMLQNGRDCLSNTCACDWKMRCKCQPLMK